jgi:hypothetical protein
LPEAHLLVIPSPGKTPVRFASALDLSSNRRLSEKLEEPIPCGWAFF